jgi:DNA-binding GntR family transcriptional regulator
MKVLSILDQLRRDIVTCELSPGSLLYEQELAQRFGISKSPVRDALLRLQEQNLVEVRARSGYRIKPVSIVEANEIYEMRQLYERACLLRAVEQASDQQIDSLQARLTTNDRMDVRDWIAMNRSFHSALAAISGNTLLAEAANRLNDLVDRLTFVSLGLLRPHATFGPLNRQHAAIVAAMKARKSRAAASILQSHIEKSRQRTVQALGNAAVKP